MTNAQVVETSVTVKNNRPIQNDVHPDDQTHPTFFKSIATFIISIETGASLSVLAKSMYYMLLYPFYTYPVPLL